MWSPKLSVGNDDIDDQHKRIFEIADRVRSLIGHPNRQDVQNALDDVVEYTLNHFAFEEEILRTHHYPDIERHMAEHKAIRERVYIVAGLRTFVTPEMLDEVMTRLTNHIIKTDADYVGQI